MTYDSSPAVVDVGQSPHSTIGKRVGNARIDALAQPDAASGLPVQARVAKDVAAKSDEQAVSATGKLAAEGDAISRAANCSEERRSVQRAWTLPALGRGVDVKAASASFTYDVERAVVELLHCDPEVAESVAKLVGCSSDAAPWPAANK